MVFSGGVGLRQPLFRCLWHPAYSLLRARESYDRMARCATMPLAVSFNLRLLWHLCSGSLFVPQGSSRQCHHRGAHVSTRHSSGFHCLGHGCFGLHVRRRDARVQLFLPAAGRNASRSPIRRIGWRLLAFLVVSVIASQLSTSRAAAGRGRLRPPARSRERLYSFSQGLLESRQRDGTAQSHPRADCGYLRSGRGGALCLRINRRSIAPAR